MAESPPPSAPVAAPAAGQLSWPRVPAARRHVPPRVAESAELLSAGEAGLLGGPPPARRR